MNGKSTFCTEDIIAGIAGEHFLIGGSQNSIATIIRTYFKELSFSFSHHLLYCFVVPLHIDREVLEERSGIEHGSRATLMWTSYILGCFDPVNDVSKQARLAVAVLMLAVRNAN